MIQIALKDLRIFFADRRAMVLTFIVPIALITLFSLAFGRQSSSESRPARLVIADEDNSAQSKNMISKLSAMKEFSVEVVPLSTAETLVRKGDENAVLVLGRGLADSINAGKNAPLELKYDGAKAAELGILRGALIGKLMAITGSSSIEKKAIKDFNRDNPGMSDAMRSHIEEQISKNFNGSSTDMEAMLKTTPLIAEVDNSPGLVQAVAGTAIMMLLFAVSQMGASLLDERQEGTLRRLLYSPFHPNNILFGKMLSSNVISLCQLTIMFTFSATVFGLDVSQNFLGVIIMIFATAFACSSFGVFLASVGKTRAQVQGLSTLIILIMSAIGGSMVPIFLMPAWMQRLAVFSVNYWGIQGFYDVFWRKLPLFDPSFLTRIAVLVGIGLLLNFVALKLFRRNALSLV